MVFILEILYFMAMFTADKTFRLNSEENHLVILSRTTQVGDANDGTQASSDYKLLKLAQRHSGIHRSQTHLKS